MVSSSLLLSFIATGYVAQREYQIALDGLVDNALALVPNRPDLQLYVYRQDQSGLKNISGDFLKLNAVSVAIAYSNLGEVLAGRDATNTTPRHSPPLETMPQVRTTSNWNRNFEKRSIAMSSACTTNPRLTLLMAQY